MCVASLPKQGRLPDSGTTTLASHQGVYVSPFSYADTQVVFQSRKNDLVEALVAFIQAASFKRVLIVAGMDAGLMQHYDK